MKSATPSTDCTNSMVATIAPGPASSGVPSGTSATLVPAVAVGSFSLSVSSSSATSSSSSPPAPCSAGSEMWRYSRICWPKNANTVITKNDTATACQAAFRAVAAERPLVSDRKIGTVPTGSMITNRVTKTSTSSTVSSDAAHRLTTSGVRRPERAAAASASASSRANSSGSVVLQPELVVGLAGAVVVAGAGRDQAEVAGDARAASSRASASWSWWSTSIPASPRSGQLGERRLVQRGPLVPAPRVRDHADARRPRSTMSDHVGERRGVPVDVRRPAGARGSARRPRPGRPRRRARPARRRRAAARWRRRRRRPAARRRG